MTAVDTAPSLTELAARLVDEDLANQREALLRDKIAEIEVQRQRDEDAAREEAAREAARARLESAEKVQAAARAKAQKSLTAFIDAAGAMDAAADEVYKAARESGFAQVHHSGEAELDVACGQLREIHRGWRQVIGLVNRPGMLLTDLP
jgi:hypothetical protein